MFVHQRLNIGSGVWGKAVKEGARPSVDHLPQTADFDLYSRPPNTGQDECMYVKCQWKARHVIMTHLSLNVIRSLYN